MGGLGRRALVRPWRIRQGAGGPGEAGPKAGQKDDCREDREFHGARTRRTGARFRDQEAINRIGRFQPFKTCVAVLPKNSSSPGLVLTPITIIAKLRFAS